MSAPLNRYELVMSLRSIVLSPANGCNVCFTCRSNAGDSRVSSQKSKALRARRTSLEADLARCLEFDDDDDCDVESLLDEWDRESSLGVGMGDSRAGVEVSISSCGTFISFVFSFSLFCFCIRVFYFFFLRF